MVLFGLLNTLLVSYPESAERQLQISRYSVTPLSPECGLIEWVPNCDTLYSLIKKNRARVKMSLHAEHEIVHQFAPVTFDGSKKVNGFVRLC